MSWPLKCIAGILFGEERVATRMIKAAIVLISETAGIIGRVIRSMACNCCFVTITRTSGVASSLHVRISDVPSASSSIPFELSSSVSLSPYPGVDYWVSKSTYPPRTAEFNREPRQVNARREVQSRRFDEHRADACLAARRETKGESDNEGWRR